MKSICHSDKGGVREWKNEDGSYHRVDGAAVEADGYKFWYINGKRHREDGPAIEYAYGYKAWYLNGVKYNEKEYYKELYKRELISKIQLLVELI